LRKKKKKKNNKKTGIVLFKKEKEKKKTNQKTKPLQRTLRAHLKRKHKKTPVKSVRVPRAAQTLIVQVDREGCVPNSFGLEGVVGVSSHSRS